MSEKREIILEAKHVTRRFPASHGRTLLANNDINLKMYKGETLGLVGESGSGKTLTLKSVVGLLPQGLSSEARKHHVTENTAMIFQNPLSALDPLCPVFRQLCEVVMARQEVSKKEARGRAAELLKRLSLPEMLIKKDR